MLQGVLLAALVAVVLALGASCFPLSSSFLDSRVQRAWFQATGLELVYRGGIFRLAAGRADLVDVCVRNPQRDTALAEANRVTIEWAWQPWHLSHPFLLRSVVLAGLTPVHTGFDQELRPLPDSRLEEIRELVGRLQREGESGGPSLVSKAFRITVANLPVSVFKLDGSTSRTLGGGRLVAASYQQQKDKTWNVSARIDLGGPVLPSRLDVRVSSPESGRPVAFSAACDLLDLRRRSPILLALTGTARGVQIQGTVTPGKDSTPPYVRLHARVRSIRAVHTPTSGTLALGSVAASLRADKTSHTLNLTLSATTGRTVMGRKSTTSTLSLGSFDLAGRAVLNLDWESLDLRQIRMRGLGSEVHGGARLSLRSPYPFALSVADAVIGPTALDLLRSVAPDAAPGLRISNGQLRARFDLTGDRRGVAWRKCEGDLDATGLELGGGDLKTSLTISARAVWTSRTLTVSQVDVQGKPGRLRASGMIARQPVAESRGLPFKADWEAIVAAGELLKALPADRFPRLKGWRAQGNLEGSGTATGEWDIGLSHKPPPGSAESRKSVLGAMNIAALEKLEMSGAVRMDLAYADHAMLPGRAKNVGGEMRLTNQSFQCKDVRAEMLESTVSLDGGLTGSPFFWSDSSVADIRVVGEMDLSHAAQAAPSSGETRAFFQRLRPEGRLGVDLRVHGRLREPGEWSVAGNLRADSVSCRLDSVLAVGEMRQASARLRLSPDRIIVDRLTGKIQSLDISTSGVVSPDGCEFGFATSGLLPDYQKTFPWLLSSDWTVAGPTALNGRFAAKMKPGSLKMIPGHPFRALLSVLDIGALRPETEGFGRAKLDERFDWSLSGAVRADNVTLTHKAAPAPLTHLTGDFLIDNDSIRTKDEVQLQWGQSMGRLSGFLRWMPEGYDKAIFEAHFPSMVLEEWLTNWGGPDTGAPEPPREETLESSIFESRIESKADRGFEADGTLSAARATFKRYQFPNSSAHFVYTYRRREHDSIRFDQIHSNFYNGVLDADAALLFIHDPQWKAHVRLRDVLCDKMLEATHGKKSTVTGLLSAQAGLTGRGAGREDIAGSGSFALRSSRFLHNPILAALGNALQSKELTDIAFSDMRGDFALHRSVVDLKKVRLKGSLLQLEANGQAGLDGRLDLMAIHEFLGPVGNVMEKIPLLKVVPKIVNEVGKILLKTHIGGTTEKPDVTIVPFSADELRILEFREVEKE